MRKILLIFGAAAVLLGTAFGGGILVLSGVLVSLLKYFADPYVQLPGITFWLMGGLSATRWSEVVPLGITSGLGLLGLFLLGWRLNLLTLSEGEAQALGVSVSGVVGWA